MTLRVEIDGQSCVLALTRNAKDAEYTLQYDDGRAETGKASIMEVAPGRFSILVGQQNFVVDIFQNGDTAEVWVEGRSHKISIADSRDLPDRNKTSNAMGPVQIRAQMPGKVIKLLAKVGDPVEAGQGLIVIEAMKMQNELKTAKSGVVSQVWAVEGATVSAGERLMMVE